LGGDPGGDELERTLLLAEGGARGACAALRRERGGERGVGRGDARLEPALERVDRALRVERVELADAGDGEHGPSLRERDLDEVRRPIEAERVLADHDRAERVRRPFE